MRHPIILSSGAPSCGCLLAHLLIHTSASDGPLLVVGETRELPDPEKMMLELTCKLPKYEITELDLKQSGYERRNPNRPFYDRFQRRRKSK